MISSNQLPNHRYVPQAKYNFSHDFLLLHLVGFFVP